MAQRSVERSMPRAALLLLALLAGSLVGAAGPAQAQDAPPDDHPEWPDGAYNPFGHSPIRIRLDFSNLTPETRTYADEVRAAMRYWENGGNGALQWEVRFEEVDEAPYDIELWLRDSPRVGPYCGESPSALGCARPFERPVGIEMVMRQENDTFRAFRLIREVAAHELGHALGLPHSPDTNDIMAAHASLRAQTAWRPGDWGRLLGGAAVLLGILGGGALVLHRAARQDPRFGAVLPLDDADGPCDAGGDHRLDLVPLRRGRGHEYWEVCRGCMRGRPLPPDLVRPGP